MKSMRRNRSRGPALSTTAVNARLVHMTLEYMIYIGRSETAETAAVGYRGHGAHDV